MNTLYILIIRYLRTFLFAAGCAFIVPAASGAEPAVQTVAFDVKRGFAPPAASFQKIFLQLAGSLEFLGSPEPYFRHIMAEHARIDAAYQKATGKPCSALPAYFTAEYADRLMRNWNKMAPVLKLEALCRESGRNLRYAMMGSWNIPTSELLAMETTLSKKEASAYGLLLQKPFFTKADLSQAAAFYSSGYDKLSEGGKTQLSSRVWLGTLTDEKREKALAGNSGGTLLLRILNEHQEKSLAWLKDSAAPKANAATLEADLIKRLHLLSETVDMKDQPAFTQQAVSYSRAVVSLFRQRLDQMKDNASMARQAALAEEYMVGVVRELVVLAQLEFNLALDEAWLNRSKDAR